MDILLTILNTPITQLLGVAIIIILMQKMGIDVFSLVKSIFKVNGKNGKLNEIDDHLEALSSNHLSHIQEGINELKLGQKDILNLLEEFREYGIRIRKN